MAKGVAPDVERTKSKKRKRATNVTPDLSKSKKNKSTKKKQVSTTTDSVADGPTRWRLSAPAASASRAEFCRECGNIMHVVRGSSSERCNLCSFAINKVVGANKPIETGKKFTPDPASSLARLVAVSTFTSIEDDDTRRARAIVNEDCPECGHNRLYFSTAQLRSADEGQTIFYECVKCNHKWSLNS